MHARSNQMQRQTANFYLAWAINQCITISSVEKQRQPAAKPCQHMSNNLALALTYTSLWGRGCVACRHVAVAFALILCKMSYSGCIRVLLGSRNHHTTCWRPLRYKHRTPSRVGVTPNKTSSIGRA
jgi:hypothetical protein